MKKMNKSIAGVLIMLGMLGCANSTEIELEGKIAMKGSEPFSYLSIKDKESKKSYKIQNQESFDLMHKQKQVIKVKAEIVKDAVGPGFPAEIKIVEVQ
ncbi:MAG: hypothetical protein L3J43_08420 [Sulfurovum sp.]|nr:hypothetical protein [Sulfurovum sp.]